MANDPITATAMNLYLISQQENNDYDTFDSAVVAAPDEATARAMHPGSGKPVDWSQEVRGYYGTWAHSLDAVYIRQIGLAVAGTEQGVICASFNAG